jgi:hypothetical protein
MRFGALVPTLVLGAALVAPTPAAADHHRSSERGRGGYQRSDRGHGDRYSPRSHRRYDRNRPYSSRRGPAYRYTPRPRSRSYYRPYGRPYYRPYYYGRRYSYPPAPPAYHPVPRPLPYGYYGGPVWAPPPPLRGGVHGGVSVGLPFFGFSLYF